MADRIYGRDRLVTPENADAINRELARATTEYNDLMGRISALRAACQGREGDASSDAVLRAVMGSKTLQEALRGCLSDPMEMRSQLSYWAE